MVKSTVLQTTCVKCWLDNKALIEQSQLLEQCVVSHVKIIILCTSSVIKCVVGEVGSYC